MSTIILGLRRRDISNRNLHRELKVVPLNKLVTKRTKTFFLELYIMNQGVKSKYSSNKPNVFESNINSLIIESWDHIIKSLHHFIQIDIIDGSSSKQEACAFTKLKLLRFHAYTLQTRSITAQKLKSGWQGLSEHTTDPSTDKKIRERRHGDCRIEEHYIEKLWVFVWLFREQPELSTKAAIMMMKKNPFQFKIISTIIPSCLIDSCALVR